MQQFLTDNSLPLLLISLIVLIIHIFLSLALRRRLRATLKYTSGELRYGALFIHHPNLVVEFDLDGVIRSVNPIAREMLGYSSGDAVGASIYGFVVPEHRALAEEAVGSCFAGNPGTHTMTVLHRDGGRVELEVTHVPIYVRHRIVGGYAVCRDVTALNETRRRLVESEATIRGIMDNMTDTAVVVDERGTFVYASPSHLPVIGYSPDEIVGRTLESFVPEAARECMRQIASGMFAEEASIKYRTEVLRKDGSVVLLETKGASVPSSVPGEPGRVVLIGRDVTQQALIERAWQESEERFRGLVEINPDAILIVKNGLIGYANHSAAVLLGVQSHEELLERRFVELLYADDIPDLQEHYERLRSGQTTRQDEFRIMTAGGVRVDVEASAILISDLGEEAYLLIMRDIRARKQAEANQREAERRLKESRDLYFRLQRSLDGFSSDLFGVMKREELDRRLLREVRSVLGVRSPFIAEFPFEPTGQQADGGASAGKITSWDGRTMVKIGEADGQSLLLTLDEPCPELDKEPVRVWLNTIARYTSVLYDHLRVIDGMTEELERAFVGQEAPPWLIRLIFNLSEQERRRLSQDLHDSALQQQILWYRRLESLCSADAFSADAKAELRAICEGLLDVVFEIRQACNELRPPVLKEAGLTEAINDLFRRAQMRSDFIIRAGMESFDDELADEQAIAIYRIVQELLANAAKHSSAAEVEFRFVSDGDSLAIRYADNGVGMAENPLRDGKTMGLSGIAERVRGLEGQLTIEGKPGEGVRMSILLPVKLGAAAAD